MADPAEKRGCLASLIQGFFAQILQFAANLVRALVGGIVAAPATALKQAAEGLEVRRAKSTELIGVRHAVLRKGRPESTAHFEGDADPETRHWVADRAGTVVGVVTVIRRDEPDGRGPQWQLRGMAVLPDLQSKGVGAALLASVHAEVDAPMWCNARETALRFYARNGWSVQGERFEIDPIGPHFRMTWTP